MKRITVLIFSLISLNIYGQISSVENNSQIINLDKFYKDLEGSFVLYDLNSNIYKVYNDSICSIRFSPCSTFKITNSLIGLETGIADNADYFIKYDSIKNPAEPWMLKTEPFKHWMKDQTLSSAIKYSVVWYYQELATRIGETNMTKLLNQVNYGNNDISSGIDNFWLCGSLKITTYEQLEFLKRLYLNELNGFSNKNQEIVKDIILKESLEEYKLYCKTGAGDCFDNKVIGWNVGFIETNSNTYIFAMNVFANQFSDFQNNMRIEMTKSILRELDVIQ